MTPALLRLKVARILLDAFLILAAFLLAYFLRVGFIFSTNFPFQSYAIIALFTTPLTLIFMFFARAYKINQPVLSLRYFQRIAFVAIEHVATFMVLYYFTFKIFFSRLMLIYLYALTTAFLYLGALIFRKILQSMNQRGIGVIRILIIGTNRPAQELVRLLIETKSCLRPVAILDVFGGADKEFHGVPVVGKLDKFEQTVQDFHIDQILQADHLEQSLNLINYALQHNLNYLMPPELLGVFQGHQIIEEWEGAPFLKIHSKKKWWQKIW
ncbi:hypothetical protein HZA43_00765 [Candidatus Peregrinibacteria bacterium]|nr:hypothetical protein [Candidatus Peregrinibacteria bacterium]